MGFVLELLIVIILVVVFIVTYLLNKHTKSNNNTENIDLCAGCHNTSCTHKNKAECEDYENEE